MWQAMKFKTVKLVWSSDLSDFISASLGRKFNVLDDGEYSQDQLVQFSPESDPDATELVARWLSSPEPEHSWQVSPDRPFTQRALNELVNRGILPDGEDDIYVHVWW